jgi:hypothetical protein
LPLVMALTLRNVEGLVSPAACLRFDGAARWARNWRGTPHVSNRRTSARRAAYLHSLVASSRMQP